jgi:hypothetical protein
MPDAMPVTIEFAGGTTLQRETDRPSQLPIVGNGPPGTFVLFPDGLRVSLPTDQVTRADVQDGRVRVELGGMRFAGVDGSRAIFHRFRELQPEERLSPGRSHTMVLDTRRIHSIAVEDHVVWP